MICWIDCAIASEKRRRRRNTKKKVHICRFFPAASATTWKPCLFVGKIVDLDKRKKKKEKEKEKKHGEGKGCE